MRAELCVVSGGSATSETDPEVTYTTIGSFHTSDFNLDDTSRLTSVGVQLPASTTTLCALVTSSGDSLTSPSVEGGLDTGRKHLEGKSSTVRKVEVPCVLQREGFVSETMDDSSKLDVAEFVVRSNDKDVVSHGAHATTDSVDAAVLDGAAKLVGGFDLCITSMMSHISSSEATAVASASTVAAPTGRKQSTALDFRDVHPEDQFAPPALIFQVCDRMVVLHTVLCTTPLVLCGVQGKGREGGVRRGMRIRGVASP